MEAAIKLALDSFCEWALNARALSPKTVKDYSGYIRRFLNDQRSVGEFWLASKPSARTRNQIRCALISYFEYLGGSNPAKNLARLKEKRPLPIPLRDPAGLIRAAMEDSPLFGTLITTLLYTGLRISECLSLRWSDIHGEWAYVIQKGGQMRAVFLNRKVVSSLAKWAYAIQESGHGKWVFQSPRRPDHPISYSWARRKIQRLGLQAGESGARPHRCRYTFADSVYAITHDPLVLKEALGHESLQSTMHYVGARPEQVRKALISLSY